MSSSKSVLEHAHAVLSNTLHYFLKHRFKEIRYMRTLLIVADMDGTHLASKHSHLIWHRQTSYRKRINRGGGGISK